MSIRLLFDDALQDLPSPANAMMDTITRREIYIERANYDYKPSQIPYPVILVFDAFYQVKAYTSRRPCAKSPQMSFQHVDYDMVAANLEELAISYKIEGNYLIISVPEIMSEVPAGVYFDQLEAILHPVFFQGRPIYMKYFLTSTVKAACIRAKCEVAVNSLSRLCVPILGQAMVIPIYGLYRFYSREIVSLDYKLKQSALKRLRFYNYTYNFASNPLGEIDNQLLRSRFAKGVYESQTASIEQRELWEQANELGSENICQKFTLQNGK